MGRRVALLLAGLLVCFAWSVPLAAQDIQNNPDADVPMDSQLAGTVRAPDGTAVPGSTLRVTQTSTGKAWITWADEDGRFEFPALPAGHFRIEISQLGFVPATKEIDLESGVKTPADLKLDVATLAAMSAPPATENPAKAVAAPPAESANSAPSGAPATNGAAPPAGATSAPSQPNTTAANTNNAAGPRARNGGSAGPGGGGGGGGGGRRAFQQVGLNGENQNPAEAGGEESSGAELGGQLGQAASADAVQMIGTVAMGQAPEGGLPQAGGPGAFGPGGGNGIPGQGPPGGFGPGGAGGPGGGGFGGPGGGRGGGGGGRGRGPQGGPQGVAALWGAERLNRQRINRMHFSIYSTYGNTGLDARPYSLYEANPPKVPGWNESAGMNMGGPLKIPHVYDGTDKTFFYINFGGTWSRTPVDQFSTVPTVAERNGDFSADNVQLYDPLSNLTGPRSLMSNAGCYQATPSSPLPPAGTCIPTNMISSQAQALLNYIPLPNIPATSIAGQNFNYHLQTNVPGVGNRLNVNVTHQISSKLSLQVNYNLSNGTTHVINSFPDIESNGYSRGQSVMIGLTQNYTKTFIHTSQLYFSRQRTLGTNGFTGVTDIASQLGLTGISTAPYDFGLPSIGFTNFTGINDPLFSLARSQTYRYVDSLRWMKEKHTVSVGGEVRRMDIDRDTDPAPNGGFSFTGLMTSQLTSTGTPVASPANCQTAAPSGPCIGSDFADFLLGDPANARVQYGNTATYFHNWAFIGYATDDWHVVPKFTLTYGIRYEAFTPPTELNGHIANLSVNPTFTQVQCVTPTAVDGCLAGSTASLFHGHYNNWAPRLGIAWQPPGKMFSGNHQLAFRAGFSMFYVQAYLNTLSAEMANQPPFATASTLTQQTFATTPLNFQTCLSKTLTCSPPTATTGFVTNTVAVNPNYQVPYAMIWNGGFEYNLAPRTFLEVMYTGTRGVHLDELLGYSSVNNVTTQAAGFTYDTSGAFSNLNSLQVRLQRRFARGWMFMARYTYSKSLDDASTIGGSGQTVIQNNADPRLDYGLSSFNMTHQFLGNFTYDLPFGDRQRFATKGWEKAVFGELRLTGSATVNSGTPYTVRVFSKNLACQNVPGVNSERADLSGNSALSNPTTLEWFDTSAFSIPTACFGDAPRNSVIGPGTFTINSGFAKSIFFGRDGLRRLDFTWNASNLLNHPNFGGLSTVLGSRTFGEITSVGAMRSMTFTTRMNF